MGPVRVGWEINFPTTDGECRQNTHSHDTFVHVQRITERTAQMFHSRNPRGSRIAHCSVSETICHPSVMSHMFPHLPQNTSTRSLSPTSLVFRPYSPSLSCLISVHSGLGYEALRDPRRSDGYTKSASPTGDKPQITRSDEFEAQRIELDRNPGTDNLEELSWTEILEQICSLEELSLTEILGQVRIKYQKEFWEMTIKMLSLKIRRKLVFQGRVADQHKSHLLQVMSPNQLRAKSSRPKRLSPNQLRPKSSRPKRSNLKTSNRENLSLTGILGRIRIKHRQDL